MANTTKTTTNETNEAYDENEFYKTPSGHTKYNEKCKNCKHSCKQSYRAILVSCSSYEPKPHNAKPAIDNAEPAIDNFPAEAKPTAETATAVESEAVEPKEVEELKEVKPKKPKKAPAKPKKTKSSTKN